MSYMSTPATQATIADLLRAIADHLPEDATWDDVRYRIYVCEAIEAGRRSIAEGRGIPHEEVMRELGLNDE